MLAALKRAVLISFLLWVMLAWGFTGIMLGIGQVIFPAQANGNVVTLNGRPVASRHVGQDFQTSSQYFWGRPSATVSVTTGKPQPYNALNSGASNLGPTNAVLLAHIRQRIHRYLQTTPGLVVHDIPISLVESSGSGLDPDITVHSALIQIPRIAKATGIAPSQLRQLVMRHVLPPALGLFGRRRVNVVLLNLALYRMRHPQAVVRIAP
jgi:K+-transporting ATPase ATPase C chain